MNSNMLLFAPLCFLLCWMLPGGSMGIHISFIFPFPSKSIPLDMVEDAVDDMYSGCSRTMTEMVKNTYFREENKGTFAEVWKNAESCAFKNLDQRAPDDEALTKDHMQAICVYTSDFKGFYKTFNDAVRENMKKYGTDFPYHSLHFWLTSAVQILSDNKKCHTTYRRTTVKFAGKVNKMMRFGSFTSSSYNPNLTDFGHKTCFKITTCSGAYLKHYSAIQGEEEVLIPPYEVFKITSEKKSHVKELSDCEFVYMLESVGVHSNLNCRAGK